MTWLLNNTQKKKELANACTIFYDFLNDQKIKESSTLTNEQLLINTINCQSQIINNGVQCNRTDTYQNQYAVYISIVELCTTFDHDDTNEKIFEYIKDELNGQAIRTILTINQITGLLFLKAALNDEDLLSDFMLSTKNKVKEVLEHIDSELSKCNKDVAKKDAFKDAIKNYFYIISDQKLDEFKDKVTSGC